MWADFGPSSTTLVQYQPNIGPTPVVCWESTLGQNLALTGYVSGHFLLITTLTAGAAYIRVLFFIST